MYKTPGIKIHQVQFVKKYFYEAFFFSKDVSKKYYFKQGRKSLTKNIL